jgi:hypothetical protein
MKYIRKFEQSGYPHMEKDIQETIDEILDKLNNKGKLSKSEKDFMKEAANGTIKKITTPSLTGNVISDASNPHNIGIMWIGKDDIWRRIIDIEEEEEMGSKRNSDDDWKSKKDSESLRYSEIIPELKPILNDLFDKMSDFDDYKSVILSKLKAMGKKLDKDKQYNFNMKIEYAINNMDSLINQFEPLFDREKIDKYYNN